MLDIELAKGVLKDENYTCVMVKDGNVCYTSLDKGLRPLLFPLIHDETSIRDVVLADKVIGKAAGLLALYGGIKEIYAEIISSAGKKLLEERDIPLMFFKEVEYIKNMAGTDMCPMEKLVDEIDDPQEAFKRIVEFIRNKAAEK